jgi:uncharacterized protein (TIGR02246 family)
LLDAEVMGMRILFMILLALQLTPSDSFEGLRQEWARDLHDKRVDASVALYTPDAVFIQPDGSRVKGRAAIRALFQKVTSTFDSSLQFSPEHVETSGNLTSDSGTYTETLVTRATGKSMQLKGSYLTIYRKEKGVGWTIAEQMWAGTGG